MKSTSINGVISGYPRKKLLGVIILTFLVTITATLLTVGAIQQSNQGISNTNTGSGNSLKLPVTEPPQSYQIKNTDSSNPFIQSEMPSNNDFANQTQTPDYTNCSTNSIGQSDYTNCYGNGGFTNCTSNSIGSSDYTNCYGASGSTSCYTNYIGESAFTNCY